MAAELLELRNLSKSFGATAALKAIDFRMQPGEFHALLGENGAGKSTIVKVVAGIHRPTAGQILWEGVEVAVPSPSSARSLGVGIVHQDSSILPDLSIEANFALGQEITQSAGLLDRPAIRARLEARSTRFGAKFDPKASGRSLATGDRKILEILKVLDEHQKLLVLDEPTASLTAEETRHLLSILLELKSSGVAILYVTHRLEEIEGVVDQVTILRDGSNVATLTGTEATKARVVSLMVGRDLADIYPPPASNPGALLYEAKGLALAGAFSGADLEVRRGEIVALVGLAGHGSFDVVRTVVGLTPSTSGESSMAGRPANPRSLRQAFRLGMGFLGEDRADSVLAVRTVRENIALAALPRWAMAGIVQRRRERDEVARLIEMLAIRCRTQDADMSSLSGGNQQKVAVGRWFAAKTSLLVLLDPTAGVDVGARAEIYKHLRAFAEAGGGVLIATSDLAEAVGLADTIHAFYRGRQVASFPRSDRDQNAVLAAITGH
jgi:ABC-type sugar transport system ATPase subunit